MSHLKIKIFQTYGVSRIDSVKLDEFESKVNEFLSSIDPEKIYNISHLNSGASGGNESKLSGKFSLTTIITYKL